MRCSGLVGTSVGRVARTYTYAIRTDRACYSLSLSIAGQQVPLGTLKAILDRAGLSGDDLRQLL